VIQLSWVKRKFEWPLMGVFTCSFGETKEWRELELEGNHIRCCGRIVGALVA
jgi:hypothetical protein